MISENQGTKDMPISNSEFLEWITTLKSKIRSARNKLAFSINSQVLELYWELGQDIAEKQQNSDWGSNFIEKIAEELKPDFPDIKGFSRRNIYAILQWYKFYSEKYQFVPHHGAQIPWTHNRLIVSKIAERFVNMLNEPLFLKYPEFKEMLEFFSKGKCKGCRKEKCVIFKNCKVRNCSENKVVDFCFECSDFPCENTGFDEHLQKRWEEINIKMKENGIEVYYNEIKDKPRY